MFACVSPCKAALTCQMAAEPTRGCSVTMCPAFLCCVRLLTRGCASRFALGPGQGTHTGRERETHTEKQKQETRDRETES